MAQKFNPKPLGDFMKEVGTLQATILLEKTEATLVSRRKAKKNWVVLDYNGKKRCAMIDA